MKYFFILLFVAMFFISGCASRKLPQTQFDVFNLKWGMSKDECYRFCDWGNKLYRDKKNNTSDFRLLRFDKGLLAVKLVFNEDDQLAGAFFSSSYNDTDFGYAREFYNDLRLILRQKYLVKWDSFTLDHSSRPDSVIYNRLINGDIFFNFRCESSTSKIRLHLIPRSTPGSLKNKVSLFMYYESKFIKSPFSTTKKANNDSAGL